jgi:hypothetical protein
MKKESMALLFTLIFISKPLTIECQHFSSKKLFTTGVLSFTAVQPTQ